MPRKEDSKRAVRLELARRLHDGPAQELIALGYKLDAVIGSPDLSPKHRKSIREARLDLISLTQTLRDELYLLEQITLPDALAEVKVLLSKIEVVSSIEDVDLDSRTESVLAQILLEIARNCAHHSKASRFWIIHSRVKGRDVFKIGNDGGKKISLKSKSLGLKLISEQASSIDATIELETNNEVFEYTIALNSRLN